ncbi:MAG: hypothetical protein QOF76_2230, partial [Solirubrobacteraceae bacterium]|nr:hypothetical protein [Solirubrobacteraceae bacterium]
MRNVNVSVVLALLLLPASAGAATVSAGKGSAKGPKGFNYLEVTAAPGEANKVDL